MVDVDLSSDTDITSDGQLFTRSGNTITGTTGNVATFQVTTTSLLLPLQFTEGMP